MGSKKNKKGKSKQKRGMSAARLASVERIERPAKKDNAPKASSADAAVAPQATGQAAELIDRAHWLGLSVSVDTAAGKVEKLLADFDVVKNFVLGVWSAAVGSDFDSACYEEKRLNRVCSWLFDDGGHIDAVLSAADKFAAGDAGLVKSSAAEIVITRLREEFGEECPQLRSGGLLGKIKSLFG